MSNFEFGETLTFTRYDESRQIQVLEFDADFVIDNVINLDIDGIPISEVNFNTDHATTINNLILAIEDHASVYSAGLIPATRQIEIYQNQTGSEFLVDEIIVSGGDSQAGGEIISKSGGFVDGVLEEGSTSEIECYISIQPLSGKEAVLLPEGVRNRRTMKAYCDTRLRPTIQESGIKGDTIEYDDTTFEVISCQKWDIGDLPHYKLVLAEVNS